MGERIVWASACACALRRATSLCSRCQCSFVVRSTAGAWHTSVDACVRGEDPLAVGLYLAVEAVLARFERRAAVLALDVVADRLLDDDKKDDAEVGMTGARRCELKVAVSLLAAALLTQIRHRRPYGVPWSASTMGLQQRWWRRRRGRCGRRWLMRESLRGGRRMRLRFQSSRL